MNKKRVIGIIALCLMLLVSVAAADLVDPGFSDVWDEYLGDSNVTINTSTLVNMTIDSWGQFLPGSVFWMLIFVIPYLAVFIYQQQTILLSMVGLLTAGSLFYFMPAEFMPAASAVLILSLSGILYSLFKGKEH